MAAIASTCVELTRLGLPGFVASIAFVIINNRKEIKLKDKEFELALLQKDKDLELERISGINEVNLIREQKEYSLALNKIKIENETRQRELGIQLAEIDRVATTDFYNYSRQTIDQQTELSKQQDSLATKIGGWVEVLNALIRPAISICVLGLILAVAIAYMDVAGQLSKLLMKNNDYKTVLEIGKNIFDTGFFLDIRSAFANILTFWFGERASYRMQKRT